MWRDMLGRLPLSAVTIPTTTDDAGHVDAGKRAGQRVSARTGVRLADHTTLRLGGSARRFVEATHTDAVIDAVRAADASGDPVLVLGGGSNLVVGDDGFAGTVIKIANAGRAIAGRPDAVPDESTGRTDAVPTHDDDTVHIDVAAGEHWDDVVAWTVDNGLGGLECLSGIPGLAGATPIQNVGAYGVEVAELLVSVDVLERVSGARRTVPAAELGLAFRTSVLKGTDRAVVLGMRFALHGDGLSRPIRYAELARTLDVEVGARVPAADARAAVLELRRRKAMVLDANDHDTWSAGSFFVNPILSPTELDDVLRRIAEHTDDR
ncbi:MAG: UDP-N-acetylmuramate dehydrogenase, partial [Sciscionella sp.]|nr:UDP-N-acetylmuramate dehydrogenase [Sciscionella sp.]